MAAIEKKLSLDLLVDMDSNRVVFAECGSGFVDIVFSFLTLPMASIIRLLGNETSLPSIRNIYKSVEELDKRYFQSSACKEMLLRPRDAAGFERKKLAVDYDDESEVDKFYKCRMCKDFVSPFAGCRCRCGNYMDMETTLIKVPEGAGNKLDDDGVFAKNFVKFIVTDDLQVRPASTGASLAIMKRFGIRDGSSLEKRTVHLGKVQIIKLLRRILVSDMPLTEAFLKEPGIYVDAEKQVMMDMIHTRQSYHEAVADTRKIMLKLCLSKKIEGIVYAEVGSDFVDLIFSYLTLPLGLVVKLLDKHSSMSSAKNLYDSIEILCSSDHYLKSDKCKNMLLYPKLAPFSSCCIQLSELYQLLPKGYIASLSNRHALVVEQEPRLMTRAMENGFVKGQVKFMITDEMVVTPLSTLSGVNIINKMMVPIPDVEVEVASIAEKEALNILRASLFSQRVLTDALSPMTLTLFEDKWFGQLYCKSIVV